MNDLVEKLEELLSRAKSRSTYGSRASYLLCEQFGDELLAVVRASIKVGNARTPDEQERADEDNWAALNALETKMREMG